MTTPWDWQPAQASRIEQSASLLRLEGADTRRFLHGQTSAAIETAAAGSWISSCSISPTARMRALVEVLLDASERATAGSPAGTNSSTKPGAWLVIHGIPPKAAEGVRQSLDRVLFPSDQVHLGVLETVRLITPVGPGTNHVPPSQSGQWQALADGSGWLLGHQVLLRQGSETPSWLTERALLSAHEQERWRVQQLIPAAPGELNDDTNPFELGLAERVSLSKGCYVGQETLAKLSTYDGVKQRLRRWSWTRQAGEQPGNPTAALIPGTTLYAPDRSSDSDNASSGPSRAGMISSSLELEDGAWIGLALVRRQAWEQPLLQAGDGPGSPTLLLS